MTASESADSIHCMTNYVRMNIVLYDNCFTQCKHNLKEMNKEIINTVKEIVMFIALRNDSHIAAIQKLK